MHKVQANVHNTEAHEMVEKPFSVEPMNAPACLRQETQKKADNTRDSQAVPHPSTNRAQRCLTWQIGRDAVCSAWVWSSANEHRSRTNPFLAQMTMSKVRSKTRIVWKGYDRQTGPLSNSWTHGRQTTMSKVRSKTRMVWKGFDRQTGPLSNSWTHGRQTTMSKVRSKTRMVWKGFDRQTGPLSNSWTHGRQTTMSKVRSKTRMVWKGFDRQTGPLSNSWTHGRQTTMSKVRSKTGLSDGLERVRPTDRSTFQLMAVKRPCPK